MSILDLAVMLGPKAVKFFAEHAPNSMKLCGINNVSLKSTLEYLAKNNGNVTIKIGRKTGNRIISFSDQYTKCAKTTYVYDKMGNRLQTITSKWDFLNHFNCSHNIERTNNGVTALLKNPKVEDVYKYQTVVFRGKRYPETRDMKMSNFRGISGNPIVPDRSKGVFKEVSGKYSNNELKNITKLKVMDKGNPLPVVLSIK